MILHLLLLQLCLRLELELLLQTQSGSMKLLDDRGLVFSKDMENFVHIQNRSGS
jgi:hypothetical protein